MPEKATMERARKDKDEGKSGSTQAGEFVREEMHHIREGKHGARSTKQAIAIGLSKARRAGVELPAPKRGSSKMKAQAKRDSSKGRRSPNATPSRTRSRAVSTALKREGHSAASKSALSAQARASSKTRGQADRSRAAQRAVVTKGRLGLRRAARKAARTRASNR